MTSEPSATRSSSIPLTAAVLVVVSLTFILFLSNIGGNGSPGPGDAAGKNGSSTQSISTSAAFSTQGVGSCPLPVRPEPAPTAPGWPYATFAFVGANSTCTTSSPSATGPSISNVSFTIDAANSTFLVLAIGTPAAAGGTGVPAGTNFTATVGSEIFPLQVQSDLLVASPVIPVSAGETTIDVRIAVLNPYIPGTYEFPILIGTFSNSSQTFQTYGNYIPVNLVAR
jgi:hypothetical protein